MIYLLFVIGFVFLVKGADFLVEGASAIAQKFGVSDIVIGMTIVAFGTSAPELVVNVLSSMNHSSQIAMGNVLGSNIANICLGLGITALFGVIHVKKKTMEFEIPLGIGVAALLYFLANNFLTADNDALMLSRTDGLYLILIFCIFMYLTFKRNKESFEEEVESMPPFKASLYIAIGLIGLTLGGNWIVDGAKHMSFALGMTERVVGLTVVAIGTSLPEIATCIAAARKNNPDIAVGNIVGSNLFNILWVLGLSSVIYPLDYEVSNHLDVFVVVLSSLLFVALLFLPQKRSLGKWKGIVLVGFYIAYTLFLLAN